MMARPRKKKNRRLPPYVYKAKGRFFLKQYLGIRKGKAKFGKEIWLAPDDASINAVWAAYSACKEQSESGTLGWIAERYFASHYFARLADHSKELNQLYWTRIGSTKTKTGTFASAPLGAITPGVIRNYLDRRAETPYQANNERGFLSVLFAFAVERDWMDDNPAAKVKRFPTEARTRYIEDWEYDLIKSVSLPYVQDCMELAYLCRARTSEILALRLEDIRDEGLKLVRIKGSKTQIIGWTDRLRAVVDRARKRDSTIASFWLIHDRHGQPIKRNALQSTWGRKMRKALARGQLKERFSFHDLKAKGVSDFEGDKFKASGHKSPRMLAVYDRNIEIVEGTK